MHSINQVCSLRYYLLKPFLLYLYFCSRCSISLTIAKFLIQANHLFRIQYFKQNSNALLAVYQVLYQLVVGNHDESPVQYDDLTQHRLILMIVN